MAQVDDKIIQIIKKLVEEAKLDNISISQAILFGSHAIGTNHEYSDIDVAVVSDNFEGNSFYDNQKLIDAMLRTSVDIETHPYRPEDFTEDDPFVQEILKNGIRVV
jgi:predicted nucleotidyltransferase